jgi:hypothetical protein
MRKYIYIKNTLTMLFALCLFTIATAQLRGPKTYYGFEPGEDRKLIDYEQLMTYLKELDAASGKMAIEQIGTSELGKPMYLVFISSEDNIRNLPRLKEINRELALNHQLSKQQQDALTDEGKAFFLFTLSMHSNEVGPSQAAPLIAWEMITSEDPKMLNILENTVYMMVPSHNPDGMNMIVEHYRKNLGTVYEGSSMPGVYHKYAGHNINRDFLTLNLSENKAVASIYSTEWFPQVMVERHQMGSTGPRFYVSPPHDPISENIQPGIWNWTRVFGSRALTDMTNQGLKGISVSYLFDNYWPGSTATSKWKGVISMLSEAASVNIASPIYVEPNELRVIGKGLSEYKISINFPSPWPGGWWHLKDIVDYEIANTYSYLHTAAIHKKELLKFRNDLTIREVELGQTEAPYYYILPMEQHDQGEMARLVNLLHEHGVDSYTLLEDIFIDKRIFKKGDIVIPLAQAFRAFIKEVMEAQQYPERHYTIGGPMIRPYDITSWSLPLHRGVEASEINTKTVIADSLLEKINIPFSLISKEIDIVNCDALIFSANNNESYHAAFRALAMKLEVKRLKEKTEIDGNAVPQGSFLIKTKNKNRQLLEGLLVTPLIVGENDDFNTEIIRMPRIALIETWFHDMDAGWTRFIFDQYQIPYTVLRPDELEEAKLTQRYDLVVFPDQNRSVLFSGRHGEPGNYSPPRYQPEYVKGMEKKGLNELLIFIENGGRVISWRSSTDLFTGNLVLEKEKDNKEEFRLPFQNISSDLSKQGLNVTGSFLRIDLKPDHPLTYGMPSKTGIFHRGNPVFDTSFPGFGMDRRVIGSFSDQDILISGFAENDKLLAGKPALLWLKKGKGEMVMFAFAPQFRGSTNANFKLLFNSILMQ